MFSLPSLPTDSLYKFLFVGSIILIISSTYFGEKQFNPYKKDKVYTVYDSLKVELNIVQNDFEVKSNFLNTLIKEFSDPGFTNYPLFNKIFYSYEKEFSADSVFRAQFKTMLQCSKSYFLKEDVDASKAELQSELKRLYDFEQNSFYPKTKKLNDEITRYSFFIAQSEEKMVYFKWYFYCCAFFGLFFFLAGATLWYIKLQKIQDLLLHIELINKMGKDTGPGEDTARKAPIEVKDLYQ